ncbi:hypothetical protein BpHYR1_038519, partial [Brachionus plicatilis]
MSFLYNFNTRMNDKVNKTSKKEKSNLIEMSVDKNETNQSLSTIKQSFEDKIEILKNDFECLINLASKMVNKVKDEETNNDNMIKQFEKYKTIESDIVKLNVGGT